MGLPATLSDEDIEAESVKFQERAKQVGHVRAAAENLRRTRVEK
jgi:hypothetical protein